MYLQFLLPSQKNTSLAKPLKYIEYLLLRKSNGTLVDTLIKKNWTTGISVDPEKQGAYSRFHLFTMALPLTEVGLENAEMISSLLFEYIALIRKEGVTWSYYNEVKFYAHRYFKYPTHKFKGPSDQIYWIHNEKISGNVLSEAIATSLASECPFHLAWKCTQGLESYDSKAILALLSYFNPERKRQVIVMRGDKVPTTNFHEMSISTKKVKLSLPISNKYFPSAYNDGLVTRGKDTKSIFNKPNGNLWHSFGGIGSDDVVICFQVLPALASFTQDLEANLIILAHYYESILKSISEDIMIADSYLTVKCGARGLEFTLFGFQANILDILDELLQKFMTSKITLDSFILAKKSALEEQGTYTTKTPQEQIFREGWAPLFGRQITLAYLVKAVKNTSFEEVEKFQFHFFKDSYIEILCLGDANLDRLTKLSHYLIPDGISKTPLLADFPRPTKLASPSSYVYPIVSQDPHTSSLATFFYLETYQYSDVTSRFINLIIAQLVAAQLKHTLEGIDGTIVTPFRVFSRGGLGIFVQSYCSPIVIEQEIESQLQSYFEQLQNIPQEELMKKINNIKQGNYPALYQKLAFYWESIRYSTYDFGWEADYFQFIKSINKSTLVDFFQTRIARQGPGRIKYSVHLMPVNQDRILPGPAYAANQHSPRALGEVITDDLDWRAKQLLLEISPVPSNTTLSSRR